VRLRAANSSLTQGCAFAPVAVRIITPSARIRSASSSARSKVCPARHKSSLPPTSPISNSATTRSHRARPCGPSGRGGSRPVGAGLTRVRRGGSSIFFIGKNIFRKQRNF
jgi:hypothetical protein